MQSANLRSSVLALLREADNVLADETTWTQDAIARGANDEAVYSDDPAATRFCLIGALERAQDNTGIHSHEYYAWAQNELIRAYWREHRFEDHHASTLAEFNDHSRVMFPHVKRVIRSAIKNLEQDPNGPTV